MRECSFPQPAYAERLPSDDSETVPVCDQCTRDKKRCIQREGGGACVSCFQMKQRCDRNGEPSRKKARTMQSASRAVSSNIIVILDRAADQAPDSLEQSTRREKSEEKVRRWMQDMEGLTIDPPPT